MTHPGHGGHRSDIEGLRGVAVVLVVLFHAGVPGWRGGFTGVDVFFVLSGYLITDLLVREVERTGTLSFIQFYARRTRRLLPAAVLAMVGTLAVGSVVFSPLEQARYVKSAIATAVYLSNVRFLRQASNYFAADTSTDPFLHTWSLAVEEQFYLAWPALVLLGFGAARSRRRLVGVIAAVSLLALVACVWLTTTNRPWAFFGSSTRAWEFGLGGLASMLPAVGLRARGAACRWVGWAGLAVIVGAGMVISGEWLFPGAWALLPALGTVAVLLAGAGAPAVGVGVPLGSRPLLWLGRLSYSWYLWHWPVLVGAAVLWPDLGGEGKLAAALVALGVAALSYVVVENRIRFHPYLMARPRLSLGLAGMLSVTGLGIALGARQYATYTSGLPSQRLLTKAEKDVSSLYRRRCIFSQVDERVQECVFGDSASRVSVVLFGDSHAEQWFPALELVAINQRWRLTTLVKSGCPSARVPVYDPRIGHEEELCDGWRQASLRRIMALRPNAVVIANSLGYVRRPGRDDGYSRLSFAEWEAGYRETLRTLDSAGVRTILLRDSPRPGFDVPVCLSRAAYRGESLDVCRVARGVAVDHEVYVAEQQAARGLANVVQVDLSDLFCDFEFCQPEYDGRVVYRDHSHVTATFVRSLAPALRARLSPMIASD